MQNTHFLQLIQVTSESPRSPTKTLQAKSFEKLLSVFRDWKSHSRGSRELSRENLCVPVATGPSTHEQVTKTDPQARDCGMRLD